MEEEREFDNSRNILETEPNTSRISVSNAGRESIVHEAFHEALSDYGCKSKVNADDFLTIDTQHILGSTCISYTRLSARDCKLKSIKPRTDTSYDIQEQSYDLSPYKESDEENVDADSVISNSKFIPSWSRPRDDLSPQKAFAASLKVLIWFKAMVSVAVALAILASQFLDTAGLSSDVLICSPLAPKASTKQQQNFASLETKRSPH
ncbi:hypothetical protein DVH24_041922 [Malus domestica]|uniref:Uncharacterized protein n=1 Tax=Malus domestica TaxID=3750 RepID=A0A498ISJ2_MALDO|nr:hypothetical protein DVH24_041922 [Malus domestica]